MVGTRIKGPLYPTTNHQHPRRGPHQGPCKDRAWLLWWPLVAQPMGMTREREGPGGVLVVLH